MANRTIRQKKGKVKDRPIVTVYAEPESLDRLDKLCEIERRSRGAMVNEILRRYFSGITQERLTKALEEVLGAAPGPTVMQAIWNKLQ